MQIKILAACGGELHATDTWQTLASPPGKNVVCYWRVSVSSFCDVEKDSGFALEDYVSRSFLALDFEKTGLGDLVVERVHFFCDFSSTLQQQPNKCLIRFLSS